MMRGNSEGGRRGSGYAPPASRQSQRSCDWKGGPAPLYLLFVDYDAEIVAKSHRWYCNNDGGDLCGDETDEGTI